MADFIKIILSYRIVYVNKKIYNMAYRLMEIYKTGEASNMANITLPVRKEYDCDVLVAGGGVSGLSAAVSAARQGARVILCEAGGVLGGTATQGLVGPFMKGAKVVLLDWMDYLRELNLASVALRLLLATMLGGGIGIERGRHGRAAGMRTHILVCVGAALSTLVGLYVVEILHFTADPMRVGAQVISGIGFLGAGMILVRERLQVTGLTTAAGLWATATIGLAVGIGFYEASLISAVLVLATNAIFPRLERSQKVRRNLVYAELESADCVNEFVRYLYASNRVSASCITGPKSNLPKAVGVEVELSSEGEDDLHSLCGVLAQLDYVVFAVEVQQ